MYEVTDISGTSGTVTVERRDEIVNTIRPWFPEAPAEVVEALNNLERALSVGENTDEFTAFLGITIR